MAEKRLEEILDQCLDRLLAGQSLEECLAGYPERAAELEPRLRAALALVRAPHPQPSPQFQAQLRRRLGEAGAARALPRKGWPGWWRLRGRWAVALAAALALLLGGASTVWAASSSSPGDALYPVKMATERVRLGLTPSGQGKARLQAQFAGARVREMAAVVEKGRPQEVERLLARLEAHLEQVERLAPGEEAQAEALARLEAHLEEVSARSLPLFRGMVGRLPEPQRGAMKPAVERAQGRFQQALGTLERRRGLPLHPRPPLFPSPGGWRGPGGGP